MTLDEAITKAKTSGDVQLAEWLRQARGANAVARWYTEKLRDARLLISGLLNENAKLRGLVREMWVADYAGNFSTLPEHQEHQAIVWQRMRELGIEAEDE